MFLIPQILYYIGFKVEPIGTIARWMPRNFFNGMDVNLSICNPVWSTTSGMLLCVLSGAMGAIIFGIIGILTLRKKEF